MSEPAIRAAAQRGLLVPTLTAVALATLAGGLAWLGLAREQRIERLEGTMPPQLLTEDNASATVPFDPTQGLILYSLEELRAARACTLDQLDSMLLALDVAEQQQLCAAIAEFMTHLNDFAISRDRHQVSDDGFRRMVAMEQGRLEARVGEHLGAERAATLVTTLAEHSGLDARIARSIQALSPEEVRRNSATLNPL
jgi:hypothetical protein